MKVVTPGAVSRHTGSKYLGVLVAAKYARSMNEFRRGVLFGDESDYDEGGREKLTTTALEAVAGGTVGFDLVDRRKDEY